MSEPQQFYVYELMDPRDGRVFYVGKGKGRRLHNHEAEARRGAHSAKCERIRDIWAAGHEVQRLVLSWHIDENDALEAEYDRINHYGLHNLTNVTPGGVLGVEAYLSRKADEDRRRVDRANRTLAERFYDLAPKFARMFRAKQSTGGFGLQVSGRWMDFSQPLEALFWDMARAVGMTEARKTMSQYGVEIVEAAYDTHECQA